MAVSYRDAPNTAIALLLQNIHILPMRLEAPLAEWRADLTIRHLWVTTFHALVKRRYNGRDLPFVAVWRLCSGAMAAVAPGRDKTRLRPGEGYLLSPWHPATFRVVSEEAPVVQGGRLVVSVAQSAPLLAMVELPVVFSPAEIEAIVRPLLRIAALEDVVPEGLGQVAAVRRAELDAAEALLALGRVRSNASDYHALHQRLLPAIELLHATLDRLPAAAELAGTCSLSVSRFYTLFHSHFGIPPARYHRLLRLEAARDRLLNTRETLEAIAAGFGFSSAYHLSRVFKQHFGQSPRMVRGRR